MTFTISDANDDVEFPHKGLVAPRYMGTLADQRDMSALGRVQVLRVCGCDLLEWKRMLTQSRGIFDSFPLLGLGAP